MQTDSQVMDMMIEEELLVYIRSMKDSRFVFLLLQTCPVCLTNAKDLAFGCGHMVSEPLSLSLSPLVLV